MPVIGNLFINRVYFIFYVLPYMTSVVDVKLTEDTGRYVAYIKFSLGYTVESVA